MMPSSGLDAASSMTRFWLFMTSCRAFMITSRRAVNLYGFGCGGTSGALSLSKSIPRPLPVSVLEPLLISDLPAPVSRTRWLVLSTPFSDLTNAETDRRIDRTNIDVNRFIRNLFHYADMKGQRDEHRLSINQLQA